jgi:hypothetical protein
MLMGEEPQMNDIQNPAGWWELHLRKARGEALSAEEMQIYQSELTYQDAYAPPLNGGLGALRKLRTELADLGTENAALRSRLSELDQEIRLVEKSLSEETREALGVKD